MSSINITTVPVSDMGEPVPAGEQSAEKGKSKPAGPRKGRPLAAATPASKEQEMVVAAAGTAAGSKSAASGVSKTEIVLKKLRSAKGATIAQLGETAGWQAHSVRGFLSAVVRKKLGLNLVSEVGKDGQRRYRIIDSEGDAAGEPG